MSNHNWQLEYFKFKKTDVTPRKTGYYFKGEFLDKKLMDSLNILRERISHLDFWEKEKTDEWKVIIYYHNRQQKISKKIHNTKKDYFKLVSKEAKKQKIQRKQQRIEVLMAKKERAIEFKIDKLNKEIKELEE